MLKTIRLEAVLWLARPLRVHVASTRGSGG
jgi:hypothetical protein